MQVQIEDYNGAETLFGGLSKPEWQEIEDILKGMPLYMKASDQAKKQGRAIFDPIATNKHIEEALTANPLKWTKIAIPKEQSFLGQDVDYGKNGTLVEVQFSNYPFLLNNVIRSELFFQGKLVLGGLTVAAVVIITKAHMFPASNSTLYFEQARQQLTSMGKLGMFKIPVRLVGLFEAEAGTVNVMWTKYKNPRYSRDVVTRDTRTLTVARLRTGQRCTFTDPNAVSVDPVERGKEKNG